jgi:hypothetical protein
MRMAARWASVAVRSAPQGVVHWSSRHAREAGSRTAPIYSGSFGWSFTCGIAAMPDTSRVPPLGAAQNQTSDAFPRSPGPSFPSHRGLHDGTRAVNGTGLTGEFSPT